MKWKEFKLQFVERLKAIYDERESQQIYDRLLIEVFHWSRAEQVLNADLVVAEQDQKKVDQILSELLLNKPLDYILGKSLFFGMDFFVDKRVLIPRPETEELVQYILERETDANISMIDIGTGSGCIPIALKLEGNYELVEACEVSKGALEVAIMNAKDLKADVSCFEMDILTAVPKRKYDVVVSNPPYVFQEELKTLDSNVKEYEPIIALAPDLDPMQFYKRILSIMPQILKKGGRIYFEIHELMGNQTKVLMLHYGLKDVKIEEDIYGRDRIASGVYAD